LLDDDECSSGMKLHAFGETNNTRPNRMIKTGRWGIMSIT